MRDVNIKNLMFVSIEHLCQSTLDMLEAESVRDSGSPTYTATDETQISITVGRWGDFAWFMWVPVREDSTINEGVPADLLTVFIYARQKECEYLVIEATDDIIPGLPVYPKE